MFRPLHIWFPSISSELPTAVEGWCAHSRCSADNHRTAINSAYNSPVLKPLWSLHRKGWAAFRPTPIEGLTLACTLPRKTPGSSVSITSHQGHACGSHGESGEHLSSQYNSGKHSGNTLPFMRNGESFTFWLRMHSTLDGKWEWLGSSVIVFTAADHQERSKYRGYTSHSLNP